MGRCIIKLRSKRSFSWCDKEICTSLFTDKTKIYKVYLVRLTNQKIAFVGNFTTRPVHNPYNGTSRGENYIGSTGDPVALTIYVTKYSPG